MCRNGFIAGPGEPPIARTAESIEDSSGIARRAGNFGELVAGAMNQPRSQFGNLPPAAGWPRGCPA
ncbi:hypothetical protein [Actinocrispum sp. NPDC049592]|uniref:hypothetical protein n=1 Tax=Actinocrispum sp. NPDC049592 TaxID=3154835 RepID=UPI00341DF177